MVSEVLADAAKALEVPGGVAGIAKENAAHVVVQAVDRVALAVKVLDGFRADQAAGAGDENRLHEEELPFLRKPKRLADGAGHIEKTEPRRREGIGGAAPGLHEPVAIIAVKAVGAQEVRGVFECREFPVAFEELVIFLSFLAFPNALFALWMIAVIVILVHGGDDRGGVNQRRSGRTREPEEPVVPTRSANHEFRNALAEKALAKGKIIDPLGGPLAVRAKSEITDLGGPIGAIEIQRLANIHIPAAAGHQKGIELASDTWQGRAEIVEQQDVAIHMAENFVPRECLRLIVNAGEILRAVTILAHLWHMADAQFAANFGSAGIVPEKNDFRIRMDALPTAQCVALDDVNVPREGLRCGEECKHRSQSINAASLRGRSLISCLQAWVIQPEDHHCLTEKLSAGPAAASAGA